MVSGNKSRMNLNVVKPKPAKAKFKTLGAPAKIKSVSTGTSVVSSVVHTVAQSLLSMAKKGKNVNRCTKGGEGDKVLGLVVKTET